MNSVISSECSSKDALLCPNFWNEVLFTSCYYHKLLTIDPWSTFFNCLSIRVNFNEFQTEALVHPGDIDCSHSRKINKVYLCSEYSTKLIWLKEPSGSICLNFYCILSIFEKSLIHVCIFFDLFFMYFELSLSFSRSGVVFMRDIRPLSTSWYRFESWKFEIVSVDVMCSSYCDQSCTKKNLLYIYAH